MARSKSLSKGTSENKPIESVDSDIKTSGLTTSDKLGQSTSPTYILTANNDAYDNNECKSQSNGRFNLLFHLIFSSFMEFVYF